MKKKESAGKIIKLNEVKTLENQDALSAQKKRAVTIIAAVLLAVLYCIIYGFSGQDSEESGAVSMDVTERCVEFVNNLSGNQWSEEVVLEKAGNFEHFVRKSAHFLEYACMGILVYLIWRPWKKRDFKLFLLVAVWVCVSAALDEWHQTFVPGRYGGISDVVLDTCGGMFGFFLISLAENIALKERMGKKVKMEVKETDSHSEYC